MTPAADALVSASEGSLESWEEARAALGDGPLQPLPEAAMQEAQQDSEGRWVAADCWADCGSKGYNKVYVKDGVIHRIGTDDTIPDSVDRPQLRACARGSSLRLWLLGADRLKYPMKRKHWEPGGGRKDLRGRDEWERISWDEALDILAGELLRTREEHGNRAILANWVGALSARVLGLFGGFTDQWGGHSAGVWQHTAFRTGFMGNFNDRYDLVKCRLFLLWGTNPVWSQAGLPAYTYWQAKKRGAKFIALDPFYNPTYENLADEWIPIRPGTDSAVLLAMIHTLLTEDDPPRRPLIDWDFLDRCTIGFDAAHLPEGASPEDNLRDYVLGVDDGVVKDARWASAISGIPADRIHSLAIEYATASAASICTGGATARVDNADSLPQLFMALAAMAGHIGQSGSMVGVAHHFGTNGGPLLVRGHNSRSFARTHLRAPDVLNPLAEGALTLVGDRGLAGGFIIDAHENCINLNEVNRAILTGRYTAGRDDVRDIDIRMIYHAHGSRINQLPNTLDAIEAHRKVDFVVTQNIVFNPDAEYSDLVLPVTSRWERDGNVCIGYREQLMWHSRVMEPYFEAKDDLWIGRELARRLGIDEEAVAPWSWRQEIFNEVADSAVMNPDGRTWEPLVTITAEDIEHYGVDGEPQQGRIPIREFEETGIYHVPRRRDDNFGFIDLAAFREDPDAHPVMSASGKLEIHCQALADFVNGLGWSEIRPIPTYSPPLEGYEATFADWESRTKGEFPLQLFNIHMPRNAHAFFDNVSVLREAFPHDFMMHPIDAQARGLRTGDAVLVRNRWGRVVRRLWVTPLIMPGVTGLGQGATVNYDEELGVDFGGCANVLKGATPTGGGHIGWNTVIVEVERWDGPPLEVDHRESRRTPLAAQG